MECNSQLPGRITYNYNYMVVSRWYMLFLKPSTHIISPSLIKAFVFCLIFKSCLASSKFKCRDSAISWLVCFMAYSSLMKTSFGKEGINKQTKSNNHNHNNNRKHISRTKVTEKVDGHRCIVLLGKKIINKKNSHVLLLGRGFSEQKKITAG